MLLKITQLSAAGVYKAYRWDQHIPKNNVQYNFSKINIIYGRNYSGKTTISRIVRSLETLTLPPALRDTHFVIDLEGDTVTEANFKSKNTPVRVFNDDFVRENLSILFREDGSVVPFATLGVENNEISAQIAALTDRLEGTGSLQHQQEIRSIEASQLKSQLNEAENALRLKLDAKANKPPNGIKHSALWGDPNYKVPKLESDLMLVLQPNYNHASDDEAESAARLLKEDPLPDISESALPAREFASILHDANALLTKPVQLTEPLKELLGNAALQAWVRDGRALHEDKRQTCGFCGNQLPADLWNKLDKHFNQESENLRHSIERTIEKIEKKITAKHLKPELSPDAIYSEFKEEFRQILASFDSAVQKYSSTLSKICEELRSRLSNILHASSKIELEDPEDDILLTLSRIENIKKRTNEYSKNLTESRQRAKDLLRLRSVRDFSDAINYPQAIQHINETRKIANQAISNYQEINSAVDDIKKQISALRSQMKDETRGAERVNELLSNFFGHESLKLASAESTRGQIFKIHRNDVEATNLSQGECSLIAFCYFIAKLDDTEKVNTRPIVWIDDPVSSLDSNHVFFLSSLIRSEILRAGRCDQLFISTHHLDFLKFAMEIAPSGMDLEQKRRHYIIERSQNESAIKAMPKYFKEQVSEFIYLFDYIYKSARLDENTSSEELEKHLAGYGNNARKFLEIYLSFKYPDLDKLSIKIRKFFGDNGVGAALVERLHHEYSHLEGRFERALAPLDVSEMRQCARFIIAELERQDSEQFKSFKKAIGEGK